MTDNRGDAIVEAFLAIAKMPESEIKSSLMGDLAKKLTIREVCEFSIYFEAGDEEKGDLFSDRFMPILAAIYGAAGFDIDTTKAGDMEALFAQKGVDPSADLKELGRLAKKVIDILSSLKEPSDRV